MTRAKTFRPPDLPKEVVPRHVAVIMDGNGRWAKQRNLPRTAGHTAGEAALFDVIEGALELGVKYVSAYAFSTENWKRSPDEVRFLMNFNREVIHRRRDEFHEMGIRVRWAGRRPRLCCGPRLLQRGNHGLRRRNGLVRDDEFIARDRPRRR